LKIIVMIIIQKW